MAGDSSPKSEFSLKITDCNVMTENLLRRDHCRLCDSKKLDLALPIKPSPIADAYIPASRLGKPQGLYPLDLYLCGDCGHIQNIDVVSPELLFRDYLFTTSSSVGLLAHFKQYAADILSGLSLKPGSLILEIGSNDGSLLRNFKERGMKVLGVDPARDIAKRATHSGIETLPEFFTASLATGILKDYGPAAVVTANNVFAHADDLADIVCGIREALADDGVFIFEVSYLVDIVEKFLFDTVYHEHVSYHSIAPLAQFFERLGMQLIDVQRVASKGGSIRGFAQRKPEGRRPVQPVIGQAIEAERQRGFDKLAVYQDYARRIAERRNALNHFLDEQTTAGKMIAGYGASTTTTTLMWDFGLVRKLSFILDDNPTKHGLYCPASHIPVMPSEELYVRKPDVVVILAWQFAAQIIRRHQKYLQEGGCIVVPLPDLKIVRIDEQNRMKR
jgi:SAM-dependent methyltransferase